MFFYCSHEGVEIEPAHLRISRYIALGKIRFEVKTKRMAEDQRDLIARTIVEHMPLCTWRVVFEDVPGHSS